jgi:hypothetical protein
MKFWEDFFSTDKIIYPSVYAFLAGFLLCIGAIYFKIIITDFLIGVSMASGFLIGNIIKINKIEEKRKIEIKLLKKSKSKKIKKY